VKDSAADGIYVNTKAVEETKLARGDEVRSASQARVLHRGVRQTCDAQLPVDRRGPRRGEDRVPDITISKIRFLEARG